MSAVRDSSTTWEAEREELLLFRRLIDMTCDLELTNGLWLEKRDGKWDVHRGTTTLVAGATTDYAVKYVMGGAG